MKPDDCIAQSQLFVRDLIGFVDFVVNTLSVPNKPIVLGWSKGTTLLLGLAGPGFLPEDEQKQALSKISSLILFEPPGSAFGLPVTKDYADAMSTISTSDPDAVSSSFGNWIAGFYEPGESAYYANSLSILSPKFINIANEPDMVRHGFYWKLTSTPEAQWQLTKSALLNDRVKIGVCRSGHTAGYLVAAYNAAAEIGAPTKVIDDKGNHFAFAHDPENWLDQIIAFSKEL